MKTNDPKRTRAGRFAKGTSGNASGRPVGSRNKATLLAEQLLDGEAEELMRQAVNLARKGNIQALRMCLDRAFPIRKERPIDLELPAVHNAQDLAAAVQSVLAAVGEGRITPGEAQSLTEILASQSRFFESVDFEQRLQKLEEYKSEAQAYTRQLDTEMNRYVDENEK